MGKSCYVCQVFAISNLIQFPLSTDEETEPKRSKGALNFQKMTLLVSLLCYASDMFLLKNLQWLLLLKEKSSAVCSRRPLTWFQAHFRNDISLPRTMFQLSRTMHSPTVPTSRPLSMLCLYLGHPSHTSHLISFLSHHSHPDPHSPCSFEQEPSWSCSNFTC